MKAIAILAKHPLILSPKHALSLPNGATRLGESLSKDEQFTLFPGAYSGAVD